MFKRGKIWYFSIDGVKESSGTTDKKRAEALERKRRQETWDKANGYYVKMWDEACLAWLESNQTLASYPQNKIFATFWTAHLSGLRLFWSASPRLRASRSCNTKTSVSKRWKGRCERR